MGNFLWAVGGGGTTNFMQGGQIMPSTYGIGLKADNFNNIYLTGFFMDTVEFGNTVFNCNCGSPYCQNFFLAAYDQQGQFKWLKQSPTGTPSSNGMDVETDEEGNIYVSGGFKTKIGFNSYQVTSVAAANYWECFISKFDNLGNCIWLINSDTQTSSADLALKCSIPLVFIGSDYMGASGNLPPQGVQYSQNQNIFIGAINNTLNCNSSIINEPDSNYHSFITIFPNPFTQMLQLMFQNYKILQVLILLL